VQRVIGGSPVMGYTLVRPANGSEYDLPVGSGFARRSDYE
jgi:hypothetical protein